MKDINPGGFILESRGPKLRVELDKKALFALASDTRMDILKALHTDRRTVSQLAELLQVDKGAVHRHLKKLEEGGFVNRVEDHSFVYYALSWKARDIISPGENTRIVVLISSAFVLLLACLLVFSFVQPSEPLVKEASMGTEDQSSAEVIPEAQDHGLEYAVIVIFVAVSSILLLISVRKIRRPKQSRPEVAENSTRSYPAPIDD